MKANLKYKLAESFCRNFALQSRNIAKTILAVFIESNEMTSSWWKNSFNIFCEAKKWKCSNLNRQKSWIAVKLWRDWSQVIASFLEIKTFSSHSHCAVKQCIQHAYYRPMPNKSSKHLGTNQCFWRFSKISWHFLKVWVGLKIWLSWKISSFFGKFSYLLLIFL